MNLEGEKLIYDIVYDYTMRCGKCIRPVLMRAIYRSIKGRIDNKIIIPPLVIELMQNASIMQDDVIDEDVIFSAIC